MRREIHDKDGSRLLLRDVRESDAGRMLRLMTALLDETAFMLRLPEEQRSSPSDEARYIRALRATDNCLNILVEEDRVPVGTLVVTGGGLRRIAHVGYLGMGVLRSAWGRGVGGALMEAAEDWARHHPVIRKLSLQVYETNTRAIALYLHHGFVEEGRLRDEVCLDGETCLDMIQMARYFKR